MRHVEQVLADYAPPASPADLVHGVATVASWLADALAEQSGLSSAAVLDAVYEAVLTRRGPSA